MDIHSIKIGDIDTNMNRQIVVLLKAFSYEEIDIPAKFYITTHPYGNCRERGFVISITNFMGKHTNVVFYEHRNSDKICAIRWEGILHVSGVVRCEDIPEEVFPDKYSMTKTWSYMDMSGPITYIREVIKEVTQEKIDA